MKIIFDYWEDNEPERVADEIKHVADMIEQGFTSGELTAGEGRGWWSIEQD